MELAEADLEEGGQAEAEFHTHTGTRPHSNYIMSVNYCGRPLLTNRHTQADRDRGVRDLAKFKIHVTRADWKSNWRADKVPGMVMASSSRVGEVRYYTYLAPM